MTGFIRLDKIRSQEEFNELVELSKKDSHGVYLPTHIVRRDGQTLGYFSVGSPGAPMVLAWLDTQQVHRRESFDLINMIECIVATNGANFAVFPVPKESPFFPLMEAMGYKNCGDYTFWAKKV